MDNYELIEQIHESDLDIVQNPKNIFNMFSILDNNELSRKDNILYNKIYSETKNIYSYLMNSIKEFHKNFPNYVINFEDTLKYLKEITIPNKGVCAGIIDKTPAWRCVDCSKYENAIYCSKCFIKSKQLHKNHQTYFIYSSRGMCDCGDPDSLYTFCPDHTGPIINQEEINEYISKSFPKTILDKLLLFFDNFFLEFSKFFILTENVDFFHNEIFYQLFNNDNNENKNLFNDKKDISLLRNNFEVVFQNLITFLRLISQNNLGILHLIAIYFLKNHLNQETIILEKCITNHRCIIINEKEIDINKTNSEKHICKCPF